MASSVTSEEGLLALLDPARHADWRTMQLRKKALIFTGCPTTEQLAKILPQLKCFKVDWKKFLNSLDPSTKAHVQTYEKWQTRNAKAKLKTKAKAQVPMNK